MMRVDRTPSLPPNVTPIVPLGTLAELAAPAAAPIYRTEGLTAEEIGFLQQGLLPESYSALKALAASKGVDAARAADPGERIVVNMGPQHPSTHGVLRLILEIEGETVTEVRCGIGYLHTGIEKNLEYRYWTQGVTFVTRMDYLSPFFNETAYCLGVEKLLGITDDIPERVNVIRVMMMELNRISSHLVALATGGMITMPFATTFWGAHFGMLVDKFGVGWMVNCEMDTGTTP